MVYFDTCEGGKRINREYEALTPPLEVWYRLAPEIRPQNVVAMAIVG